MPSPSPSPSSSAPNRSARLLDSARANVVAACPGGGGDGGEGDGGRGSLVGAIPIGDGIARVVVDEGADALVATTGDGGSSSPHPASTSPPPSGVPASALASTSGQSSSLSSPPHPSAASGMTTGCRGRARVSLRDGGFRNLEGWSSSRRSHQQQQQTRRNVARERKSLRNEVHNADAVVWGPV
eukprot:31339-Pelagococcus_subviridis.AAC.8